MSVLIRGMEMPTSCVECGFKINCDECEGYECCCAVLHKSIGYMPRNSSFLREDAAFVPSDCRREDCPLVPIPPHGGLIDADALIERIGFETRHYVVKDEFDRGRVVAWNNVIRAIREYAPTIIPAE